MPTIIAQAYISSVIWPIFIVEFVATVHEPKNKEENSGEGGDHVDGRNPTRAAVLDTVDNQPQNTHAAMQQQTNRQAS